MSIFIACPSCGSKLRIPDGFSAPKAKCGKCGYEIAISRPAKSELSPLGADLSPLGSSMPSQQQPDVGAAPPEPEAPPVRAAEQPQMAEAVPCFYCGENPPQDALDYSLNMFLIVRTEGSQTMKQVATFFFGLLGALVPGKKISYRKRRVKVPRCRSCHDAHNDLKAQKTKTRWSCGLCGVFLGAMVGLLPVAFAPLFHWGLLLLVPLGALVGGLLIGLVIGFPLSYITRGQLPMGVLDADDGKQCPQVVQLLAQDWKIGEQPDASGGKLIDISGEAEREPAEISL